MARPTKCTPGTVDKLVKAIRAGSTYVLACAYAGISVDAFDAWRRNKPDFAALIKEAEGAAAVGWLQKIEDAADEGNWQAAAWKLERRYPQDYGRKVTELQGKDGADLRIIVEYADTDHPAPAPASSATTGNA